VAGSHHYQALVLDSHVVQYFASQAEACDLFPVGECDLLKVICCAQPLHATCAVCVVLQLIVFILPHSLYDFAAGDPFETFNLAIAT
jgi:hypothetical protein